MRRVLLQPAYVLHTRSYRETSLLIELFTPDYGRLSLIAKGVRKPKSALAGLFQPFVPLIVSWSGKNELMSLSYVEAKGVAKHLRGECLFAGLYLNELLIHLLQKWDAHTGLFSAYEKTISGLQTEVIEEKILRSFEKYLLEELGYGVLPKSSMRLNNELQADKFYKFTYELGLVLYQPEYPLELNQRSLSATNIFLGKNLIAIAKEDWQDSASLQDAKRLTRFVLAHLLGDKQIHSRQLFNKKAE